jgi:hypothetical protein
MVAALIWWGLAMVHGGGDAVDAVDGRNLRLVR